MVNFDRLSFWESESDNVTSSFCCCSNLSNSSLLSASKSSFLVGWVACIKLNLLGASSCFRIGESEYSGLARADTETGEL